MNKIQGNLSTALKKYFLISFVFILIFTGVTWAIQDNAAVQKNLEIKLQEALDKLLGEDKAFVVLNIEFMPQQVKIEFAKPEEAKPGEAKTKSEVKTFHQNIAPGIPSLKFMSGEITEGDVGLGGAAIDYTITQLEPVITKISVILVLDTKVSVGDTRKAKDFATQFLKLDETRGDTIQVIKEAFAKKKGGINGIGGINGFNPKEKKIDTTKFVFSISIGAAVIIIMIMIAFFILRKRKLPGQQTIAEMTEEQKTDAAKPELTEEEILQQQIEAETRKRIEENEKRGISENDAKIIGNGMNYFKFVTEENVYKLKFLLQLKIALNQATPKTVAIVLSCLPFKLASSILLEYPLKIQSEIAFNLLDMQYLPEENMAKLEQEVMENIDNIFGGKYALQHLLNKIDGTTKKELLTLFKAKYPTKENEFGSLVMLFEDLFKYDEASLQRIFNDLDAEIIAAALVNIDKENQERALGGLSKGVRAMVDQWLELKGRSATRREVENARSEVNKYAQYLIQEGFVKV